MKPRRRAILAPFLLLLHGCTSPRAATDPRAACGKLRGAACTQALGLVAAASAYGDIGVDYALDPSGKLAAGRALERTARGAWRPAPGACARPTAPLPKPAPQAPTDAIDFAYVGVLIDDALVSADADAAPFAGPDDPPAHRVALVAFALARDTIPTFVEGASGLTPTADGCACGRATHFAGAARSGGLLTLETTVAAGHLRGRAIDVFRAAIDAGHVPVETRLGGLDVRGLDAFVASAAPLPLRFSLASPVPVAVPVYPIADLCRFALPAPDVAPTPLDFGDAPYGTEVTRPLHVTNRAPVALDAILGARTLAVPPRGTLDIPLHWVPDGDAPGCETQTREETILFVPRGARTPLTPTTQTARVVERIRTGPPTVAHAEHLEAPPARRPAPATTQRDWTCPRDFVLTACRAERPQCSDVSRICASTGASITAAQVGNGCHFACKAPPGQDPLAFCRFEASMECRLRCTGTP
jgi:hypothetical protein